MHRGKRLPYTDYCRPTDVIEERDRLKAELEQTLATAMFFYGCARQHLAGCICIHCELLRKHGKLGGK